MASRVQIADQTLSSLETRLQKVEYVLNGHSLPAPLTASDVGKSLPPAIRLRNLERGIQLLANKSRAVMDVLELQKEHPQLFHSTSPSAASTSLSLPALASLVTAHTMLYRNLASQLSQLQEITVPDPSSATALLNQQARIEKVRAKQEQQSSELASLRARSATLVEAWYTGGVLEMGERWADWEQRLREVEILVRRKEAVKKREEGIV